MSSIFKDISIAGVATQTGAPTEANHLVRLQDVQDLLAGNGFGYTGYAGIKSLNSGVDSGSVTGLALAFTPTKCLVKVVAPSGGLLLDVVATHGTITANGFDFVLTGTTDNANYKLHYVLLP